MIEDLVGQKVVVDLRSPFVCLGTLHGFDADHLDLRDVDFHDLRDSDTTRENYVAKSKISGVLRNRKRVLLTRSEVVAVSLLHDIIAD
jgi:hypothetical protein